MRAVYFKHRQNARGDFVMDLPESALGEVEGFKARKDAATAVKALLADARAALAVTHPGVRIGIVSAYRSATRQLEIWIGRDPKQAVAVCMPGPDEAAACSGSGMAAMWGLPVGHRWPAGGSCPATPRWAVLAGCSGSRDAVSLPEELQGVVDGHGEFPFGVDGTQSPPAEPPEAPVVLHVAEDRLDGVLALGVGG